MSATTRTPAKTSHDLPKPDDDLAEWTSRIKAMARQADADEEAEQLKLEEEIAAARRNRARRSRGLSTGRSESLGSALRRELPELSSTVDDLIYTDAPKTQEDRQAAQETALRKLMDTNQVHNPDRVGLNKDPKVENVSLASFIGGRATGPKLNKPAPQPDAHDPTLFQQPDLSAPHPIFGRGGIAMPGMTAKKSPEPYKFGTESSERYRSSGSTQSPTLNATTKSPTPSGYTQPKRSPSTPAVARKYLEQIEQAAGRSPSKPNDDQKTSALVKEAVKPWAPKPADSTPTKPISAFTSSAKSPDATRPAFSALKPTSSVSQAASLSAQKPPPSPVETPPSPVQRNVPDFDTPPASPQVDTSTTTTPLRPAFSSVKSAPSTTTSFQAEPKVTPSSLTNEPSKSSPSFLSSFTPTRSFGGVATAQSAGLRKIMNSNQVHVPATKASSMDAQHSSLASFIGGKSSGPRLNKPAPQPDATDHTQFIQPDLSAPHPIFGRGGIAMPGMVAKKDDNELEDDEYDEFGSSQFRTSARARTKSTPAFPSTIPRPFTNGTRDDATPSTSRPLSLGYASQNADPDSSSSRRPRSSLTIPSLARPLQPEPKQTSFIQPIPVTPSAFQKTASPKELTPSLTRLKGRGFVQNMVKATSEFGSTSTTRTPSPDKSMAGSRKGSVMSRWTHADSPSAPLPTEHSTPSRTERKPVEPVERAEPIEPLIFEKESSIPPIPLQPKRSDDSGFKLAKSDFFSSASDTSESIEGKWRDTPPTPTPSQSKFGSSSTRVFVQTKKSNGSLKNLGPDVDDFGGKADIKKGSLPFRAPTTDKQAASRKPLIHLTKKRPRKPSKQRDPKDWTQGHGDSHLPTADISQTSANGGYESWDHNDPDDTQSEASFHSFRTVTSQDFAETSAQPPTESGLFITSRGLLSTNLKADYHEPSSPLDSLSSFATDMYATPMSTPPPPSQLPILEDRPRSPNPGSFNLLKSPPSSPSKQRRIQTTGKRVTAMDLAKSLQDTFVDASEELLQTPTTPLAPLENFPDATMEMSPRMRRIQAQSEKRRSSVYERYSVSTLPPLTEERTPVPSPSSTLHRTSRIDQPSLPEPVPDTTDDVFLDVSPRPPLKELVPSQVAQIDVSILLQPQAPATYDVDDPDKHTVSVEVLSVVGKTAAQPTRTPEVFYESEIILVITRSKSKSSGLVSTRVWCWVGRLASLGDKENKKVNDIAARYNTSLITVHQGAEPLEMIKVLGGCLAVRQGTRSHWSAENTTMHIVRLSRGVIIMEECDFSIQNLCSGFSYCITLLGYIYIWHGRGSVPAERKAALGYALGFGEGEEVLPQELLEGGEDQDEMFSMMLGDDDYAMADYWQWRATSKRTDPAIWRIQDDGGDQLAFPVEFISTEDTIQSSIYLIDCIWEIFVLVGKDARDQKSIIGLALDIATKLAGAVASERPYTPTIHALVLPTQIPQDLRLHIRDLNEQQLNKGEVPEHMNLIPHFVAIEQLNETAWDVNALSDPTMLPLGVGHNVRSDQD